MKNLMKLSKVLALFICFAFVPKNEKITVIIDAGHGGTDLGLIEGGISEKEIVASISQKIQILNNNPNIEILLTRNNHQDLSLQERVEFNNAMKPNLVISLHANSAKNISANGLEIYISEKSAAYLTSRELAKQFSISIANKTPLIVLPLKVANFFILKKSEVPTLLVQLGYLSNEKDKAYLVEKKNQIEMAQHVLDFISILQS